MLTVGALNTALDTLDSIAKLSLHFAYDAAGGNEIAGGSPAYARMPVIFSPAFTAQKVMFEPVTFDVPLGTTVAWLGFWTLADGFIGMSPLVTESGSTVPRQFIVDDATTDRLICHTHALADGHQIVIWPGIETLPDLGFGLDEGFAWYVVDALSDSFRISAISGGIAHDFGLAGAGIWQRIGPKSFVAQGTLRVSALTFAAVSV